MIFFSRAACLSEREEIDPAPYETVWAKAAWRSPGGRQLIFCLLGERGAERARTIAVYERTPAGWRRLFVDQDRRFQPWTIRVAELDGDPLPEVAVGVWKKARYHPVEANRLFIFDWTEEERLFPKWLGSRLGLPFERFAFVRAADGFDRLLTVEHAGKERLVLRQYHWNGFGFSHDYDVVRIERPADYEAEFHRLTKQMEKRAAKGEADE